MKRETNMESESQGWALRDDPKCSLLPRRVILRSRHCCWGAAQASLLLTALLPPLPLSHHDLPDLAP